MYKTIKRKIFNYLMRNLYCSFTVEDVFQKTSNGGYTIGGQIISSHDMNQIVAEAEYFKLTLLYRVLMSTPKHHASEVMYKKSVSYDDMIVGKSILYGISLQETIINNLTKK